MEEEKDFACRTVLGLVSEYLYFKEGILPQESLSDLCKEVFGIADDSKNHDEAALSECNININIIGGSCSENDEAEAVLSKCNINIGGSSSDSEMSLQKREAKKERNNKASPSKKHNNTGVSKKSLKRKAKKKSTKPSPPKKHKNNNDNDEQVQEDLQPAAELPMAFRERIEEMEGVEVKLVIEKELTKSDLNQNNGRFSIPKGKIREEAKNFLTPAEEFSLDVRGKNKRLTGLSVSLLDPTLRLCDDMCFKKWEMDTTQVYNITRGWNHVVAENNLRANDKVQLWSFRSYNQLYFALVKL